MSDTKCLILRRGPAGDASSNGGLGRGVRSRGDTLYFIRCLSAYIHEDDTFAFLSLPSRRHSISGVVMKVNGQGSVLTGTQSLWMVEGV